jgi:hypothetical protein
MTDVARLFVHHAHGRFPPDSGKHFLNGLPIWNR